MITPDALVHGALDLHAHGSPEFTLKMPGRVTNVEWGRLAVAAGMRGYVIKSHVFPTMGAAHAVNALFPELSVFPSITLNPTAGGISALSVELAIEAGRGWCGCRPGPRASRTRCRASCSDEWSPSSRASTCPSGRGRASPCLTTRVRCSPRSSGSSRFCASRGVVVASGHIPIAASLVMCRRAGELGTRFVLTHPLSASVGATTEDQIAIAEMGGMIEHVFVGCMPMHQRMDPRRIVEAVQAVGAEHCVMATDAIEEWNPPEPELLRMYVATLLSLGVPEDQVHLMTHDNPAKVLGLDPKWAPADPGAASEHR